MVGNRLQRNVYAFSEHISLTYTSNQVKTIGKFKKTSKQTEISIRWTHMLKIRSQSSTWSSLTTPNNVEQFGDHLTKNTGPWWMDLNVITGRPCFHIWTVSSREQLKNTSGLNGDHSMWFTDPWESKIRHEEKPASIFHFWINIINVVINQMGSKVTHRITEDSTVCAAVFFLLLSLLYGCKCLQ